MVHDMLTFRQPAKSISYMQARDIINAPAQGIWADSRWCFSVGLDQRLRSWRITPSHDPPGAHELGTSGLSSPASGQSCDPSMLGASGSALPTSSTHAAALLSAEPHIPEHAATGARVQSLLSVKPERAVAPLFEEGPSTAVQVLEPGALAVRTMDPAQGCYCVALAGRGTQMLRVKTEQ